MIIKIRFFKKIHKKYLPLKIATKEEDYETYPSKIYSIIQLHHPSLELYFSNYKRILK